MEKFIAWLEKHLMPIANKIAKQRHLMAIRDTFMTILPPLFFGAIIAVINSWLVKFNHNERYVIICMYWYYILLIKKI